MAGFRVEGRGGRVVHDEIDEEGCARGRPRSSGSSRPARSRSRRSSRSPSSSTASPVRSPTGDRAGCRSPNSKGQEHEHRHDTLRRALLDLGIDETGVDEAELLSRTNQLLAELGQSEARRDRVRQAVEEVLRGLLAEQRQPVPAADAFESEWADGVDQRSLSELNSALAWCRLSHLDPNDGENVMLGVEALREFDEARR